MLTRPHRLTTSRGFTIAVRHGRRSGTATLVVHLLVPPAGVSSAADRPPQVGFVVGKAVGPAVTRNLVKRRLRALARERIDSLPRCSTLVVRALPPAADATYAALGADMDRALSRSTRVGTRSRNRDTA
jgi:ribonuclease P protein component